jgi:flagellar biosynthesis protein
VKRKKRKTHKAAALSYRSERDAAPRVTASGRGKIADKILETARAAGVPVHEDSGLAEVLSQLDPGEEIPAATYRAVAEILAFLYRLDQGLAEEARANSPPGSPP